MFAPTEATDVFPFDNSNPLETCSTELTVGLPAAYHLLTVPIQCIIDDRFGGNHFMVVLEPEMAKAFGDRIESSGVRLVPKGVVGVGPVHNLGQ